MIEFSKENVFLVTGASSGLGKEIVLKLNSLGATVIAVARSEEKLNLLKEEITHADSLHVESFDLSLTDEIQSFMKTIVSTYGKLTGVVHSAGIGGIEPLKVLSLESAKQMFEINYFSALALAKSFCDKRIFTSNFPSMIFLSSISSMIGNSGLINYSATKGAINSMVKALAVEQARSGIRINAVAPGFIVTDIVKSSPEVYNEEYFERVRNEYPLGEGEPNDVASLVVFLASKEAKWITGQTIVVDGGRTLI